MVRPARAKDSPQWLTFFGSHRDFSEGQWAESTTMHGLDLGNHHAPPHSFLYLYTHTHGTYHTSTPPPCTTPHTQTATVRLLCKLTSNLIMDSFQSEAFLHTFLVEQPPPLPIIIIWISVQHIDSRTFRNTPDHFPGGTQTVDLHQFWATILWSVKFNDALGWINWWHWIRWRYSSANESRIGWASYSAYRGRILANVFTWPRQRFSLDRFKHVRPAVCWKYVHGRVDTDCISCLRVKMCHWQDLTPLANNVEEMWLVLFQNTTPHTMPNIHTQPTLLWRKSSPVRERGVCKNK
jgi:hypothetical protein